MTVADRIAAFRAALDEWLRGLYHGMITHPAYEKIEKEAEDTEDEFMLACFPDAFGIPSPVSYYTAELGRVKFGVNCGRRRRLRANFELSQARHC